MEILRRTASRRLTQAPERLILSSVMTQEDPVPRLTLAIPAFNEARFLPRLLDSIDVAAQRYAHGAAAVEVIVADNASTDRTAELARGRGCRVAPGRPKPRASIASARHEARSSDPATSGESSFAYARAPDSSMPRPRTVSRRPIASRSSVGTSRVASATASAERRAKRTEPTRRS